MIDAVSLIQDDKDLVHEFVNNDGLDCLIKVASEEDQSYQNYTLRGKQIHDMRVDHVLVLFNNIDLYYIEL